MTSVTADAAAGADVPIGDPLHRQHACDPDGALRAPARQRQRDRAVRRQPHRQIRPLLRPSSYVALDQLRLQHRSPYRFSSIVKREPGQCRTRERSIAPDQSEAGRSPARPALSARHSSRRRNSRSRSRWTIRCTACSGPEIARPIRLRSRRDGRARRARALVVDRTSLPDCLPIHSLPTCSNARPRASNDDR